MQRNHSDRGVDMGIKNGIKDLEGARNPRFSSRPRSQVVQGDGLQNLPGGDGEPRKTRRIDPQLQFQLEVAEKSSATERQVRGTPKAHQGGETASSDAIGLSMHPEDWHQILLALRERIMWAAHYQNEGPAGAAWLNRLRLIEGAVAAAAAGQPLRGQPIQPQSQQPKQEAPCQTPKAKPSVEPAKPRKTGGPQEPAKQRRPRLKARKKNRSQGKAAA